MQLRLNLPYVVPTVAVLIVGVGTVPWLVTSQSMDAIEAGLPLPGGWSLPGIALLWLFALWFTAWLLFHSYRCANTLLDDQAVAQPGLTGMKTIQWAPGVRIEQRGAGILVTDDKQKITISPYAYRDPDSVREFLYAQAERLGRAGADA